MMQTSAPSQSELGNLLGLIELVRLCANADGMRDVIAKLRDERKAFDEAFAELESSKRAAVAKIAEAESAEARLQMAQDAISKAVSHRDEILSEARSVRQAALDKMSEVNEMARSVALAAEGAEASKIAAAQTVQTAKIEADRILREADERLGDAERLHAEAKMARDEAAAKLARLRELAAEV